MSKVKDSLYGFGITIVLPIVLTGCAVLSVVTVKLSMLLAVIPLAFVKEFILLVLIL